MKDYVILVGALCDGRAGDGATCASSPGKPRALRGEHAQPLRPFRRAAAAFAEGAALIARAQSRRLVRERSPIPAHRPDALAKSGRKLKVVPVNEKLVLDDGARKVEVYRVRERSRRHAARRCTCRRKSCCPGRRVHAGAPGSPPPPAPPSNQLTLVDAIERLKLQVERHLPLHGRIVPNAELYRAAGRLLV